MDGIFGNNCFCYLFQIIQDFNNFVWEELFRFLIYDLNYQELDIEVSIFCSFFILYLMKFVNKVKNRSEYC